MKDGQQIRFSGEGDQEPGLEPGDVVIILEEKEHATFQRHGQDLITAMQITLVESLCGLQKTITTLDKRTLVISTIPGQFMYITYILVVFTRKVQTTFIHFKRTCDRMYDSSFVCIVYQKHGVRKRLQANVDNGQCCKVPLCYCILCLLLRRKKPLKVL